MNKKQLLFAGCLFLLLAFGLCAYWVYATNYTEQAVFNQVNNETAGAIQIQAIGRGLTSPNLTSNATVQTLLNTWFNSSTGTLQAYIDSSSGDIPFMNTTSLTDGDLLKYDTTGDEWINTEGEIIINDDNKLILQNEDTPTAPTLAFGDGDTGFYQDSNNFISVATGGSRRFAFEAGVFGPVTTGAVKLWDTAGAASGPTIYFAGDSNTGIWRPGADQVAITAGGTNRLSFTTSLASFSVPVDVNGLTTYATVESVADDATIATLASINSSGWGVATAGDNAEYCPFTFAADGTVTMLTDVTANCANSSSDGNLCVYSSGSNGLTIENKLGSELTIKLEVKY